MTAMQRVLVTGAGGFLGGHVTLQLLARGADVRTFSRGTYRALAELPVECLQGDLRDPAAVQRACQGVDTVIHTAALAGIWGPWKTYYQINTLGTRHIIEACRAAGVQRLVYSSSPSVTFEARDQNGIDESAPYARRWLAHYPHTKALAEQEVLAANGRDGLSTCALRPHLIWGPGDPHLISRLIDRAVRGQLRRIGSGRNLIDICYVDNAAEAHVLAAERLAPDSPAAGRAYFISQGEPVNCWQWIDDILRLAHLPPVDQSISFRKAWWAGAVLERAYRLAGIQSEPRMTRFLAAQLATSHYFDISAAQRDLGFAPRISTAEGMQRLKDALDRHRT